MGDFKTNDLLALCIPHIVDKLLKETPDIAQSYTAITESLFCDRINFGRLMVWFTFTWQLYCKVHEYERQGIHEAFLASLPPLYARHKPKWHINFFLSMWAEFREGECTICKIPRVDCRRGCYF